MLTPDECAQARKLLGWTKVKLAAEIGVGGHVVDRFEVKGIMTPPARWAEPGDRKAALRAVLEAAGIEFIDGNEAGVRLRVGI